MKWKRYLLAVLFIIFFFTYAHGRAVRGKKEYYDRQTFKGTVIMDGKDAFIENLRSTDNIVWLSTITTFQTWSGAASGSSYW